MHLALVKGSWDAGDTVPVRVHEPLSVLDALEVNRSMHSWGLDTSLHYLASQGKGVAVLLNCGESAEQLLAQFEGTAARRPGARARPHGPAHLRHWRADPARMRRAQDAPHGQPAPHAQHDRLRPGNHRLHGRRTTEEQHVWRRTRAQPTELDGKNLHIGIVQARFNESITDALAAGLPGRTGWRWACAEDTSTMCTVPGALEVPVALQALAEKDKYDALIALGCIIRGETYHFELVANESGAGVSRVALDYQLPIANAILTTENVEQAVARQTDKGRDAARVAVEMANLLDELS